MLIARLADTFRFAMNVTDKETVLLKNELAFIQNYLALEQHRFGDRLSVVYEVDEGLWEYSMPPMLLQPLIENALKHGIAKSIEGGQITVRIFEAGRQIHFVSFFSIKFYFKSFCCITFFSLIFIVFCFVSFYFIIIINLFLLLFMYCFYLFYLVFIIFYMCFLLFCFIFFYCGWPHRKPVALANLKKYRKLRD